MYPGSVVSPIKCFVRWRIPYPAHNSLRLTTVLLPLTSDLPLSRLTTVQTYHLPLSLPHIRRPMRPAYVSICQPPRPGTSPSQVGSPVGSFSIFSWLGRSGFHMTFPFRSSLPFSLPISWPAIFGPFSPATLFLINSAPIWPPFLPPSPLFCRALAAFFTARPRLHATRSSNRLIAVLSPSTLTLIQVGLRPPSFRFCFFRRAAF